MSGKASQVNNQEFCYCATYFNSRTTAIIADMLQTHEEIILNSYAFCAADFLSGYRPEIWHSSSAKKQVLQATCSNPTVNIPIAEPVTKHRYYTKCKKDDLENML